MRFFLTVVHLIVSGAVLFILFPLLALSLDKRFALPSFSFISLKITGGALALLGTVLAFVASYLLGVKGKGTPNPIKKTRLLVREGIYRYMRNPMLAGAILISLGSSLFLGSTSLLAITGGIVISAFLYLHFYEERELEHRFGEEYLIYKREVPRFIPKFSGWLKNKGRKR